MLVADNDPTVRELAELALVSRNYAVVTVGSGQEALAQLQQTTPSLVVLAAELPGVGGLEVADRMRRVPRLKGVPLVLLAQGAPLERAPEADALLTKPFTGGELGAAVERLLEARQAGAQAPQRAETGKPRTVMVIEDSAALRGLITDVLNRQGYRVLSAENVPQARALIAKNAAQVNLVLLDVNLPGGTGFELLKLVRERSQVPVFILSALRQEEQIAKGRTLGAQAFIEKPFNPRELVRKVKEVLG